jgi:hypothetical protein
MSPKRDSASPTAQSQRESFCLSDKEFAVAMRESKRTYIGHTWRWVLKDHAVSCDRALEGNVLRHSVRQRHYFLLHSPKRD